MIAFNIDNTRDYSFINEFSNEYIYDNQLVQIPLSLLIQNSDEYPIDNKYLYRPDKLAYEIYGDDLYYPWILQANSLGSIAQFIPSLLNNKAYIPRMEFIQTYYKQNSI